MKNYLIYLLAAVSCTTVADLNAQVSTKTGNETTELTIPKKFYKDSIDFSNAPKRLNNKYPLSDQKERRRMGSKQKRPLTSSKERS